MCIEFGSAEDSKIIKQQTTSSLADEELKIIATQIKDPIAKSIEFLQSIVSFCREIDNQNMLEAN